MREIKFRAWDKKLRGYIVEPVAIFGDRVMVQRGGRLVDIPEAVALQFTGLLDKNGKEIYEGDVVRHSDSKATHAVEWFRGCDSDEHSDYVGWKFFYSPEEIEVIDNVWQHPELLTQ